MIFPAVISVKFIRINWNYNYWLIRFVILVCCYINKRMRRWLIIYIMDNILILLFIENSYYRQTQLFSDF